jgi:hypothetical protein
MNSTVHRRTGSPSPPTQRALRERSRRPRARPNGEDMCREFWRFTQAYGQIFLSMWSWIATPWRICTAQSCTWWCLCCNIWLCWIALIIVGIILLILYILLVVTIFVTLVGLVRVHRRIRSSGMMPG